MKTKEQLLEAIKQYLVERLQKFNCVQGTLTGEYRPNNITLFNLNGTRKDGRNVLIWELDQSFKNNVDALLEQAEPIGYECRVDLLTDNISFFTLPVPPPPPPFKPEPVILSDEPYGTALAEAVAEALSHNNIGYSHRDYCGTGMEKYGETYQFGSIWDGGMVPQLKFPDKISFIEWLAVQSDSSLGSSENYNYQDIDRKRLENFVAKGQDSHAG